MIQPWILPARDVSFSILHPFSWATRLLMQVPSSSVTVKRYNKAEENSLSILAAGAFMRKCHTWDFQKKAKLTPTIDTKL